MLKHSLTPFVFYISWTVCGQVCGQETGSPLVPITTESAMHDASGQVIQNCLQPRIAKFGDTWYAYGFVVRKAPIFESICYSSTDLKTWTLKNLSFANGALGRHGDIPLFYVLYNSKNKEYVGYGEDYGKKMFVYTSPSATGPFTFHNALTDVHGGPGDPLVFPDTDGNAYFIYNKYQGPIPQRYAYGVHHRTCDEKMPIPKPWENTV